MHTGIDVPISFASLEADIEANGLQIKHFVNAHRLRGQDLSIRAQDVDDFLRPHAVIADPTRTPSDLHSNQLTGTVPQSLSALTSLTYL